MSVVQDTLGRLLVRHRDEGARPLPLTRALIERSFGHPRGLLGRAGGWLMARRHRALNAWVIESLELAEDHRVLEVGFGPGVAIEHLVAAVPRGRVAGVDPSAEMVLMARARNLEAVESGRVTLTLGTAGHLPFDDATFDRALAVNNLQHWPDPHAGLRELLRVLEPGGKLAVAFAHPALQADAGWLEWLADAGFEGLEVYERDGAVCAVVTRPGPEDTDDAEADSGG